MNDRQIKQVHEIVKEALAELNEPVIYVKKLDSYAVEPTQATSGSSGFDVTCVQSHIIPPGERLVCPTGLAFGIPQGYEIQVRPRSGLAAKKGITVLNAPGTIDSDYTGEVCVILLNTGDEHVRILMGERIAQLVVAKISDPFFVPTDELRATFRGDDGFGSTGRL